MVRGRVRFDQHAVEHLRESVIPLVDQIVEPLGRRRCGYELSITNISAASVRDIGFEISGFSADVPVFLAMLSAALRVPMPQNVVATGHLASSNGDIRAVRDLPAKAGAALADASTDLLVYPSLDADRSLQVLSPQERDRASEAIATARLRLRTLEVENVAQLLQGIVSDEAVLPASLRGGFFDFGHQDDPEASPIAEAIGFLTARAEARFWQVLETQLLDGRSRDAQELLLVRTRAQIKRREYPVGFGCRLWSLLASLPPAIRKVKTTFPLLPMDYCLKVSRFARAEDHDDVQQLLDAATGRVGRARGESGDHSAHEGVLRAGSAADVEALLNEISSENLTKCIGLPIDSARASYVIGSVTVDSYEEFEDTITSFYLTLLRHTGTVLGVGADAPQEAMDLVGQAFSKAGGWQAAMAEAQHGVNGGMRFILDLMTEQYKTEKQRKRVERVLKQAVDPRSWEERVTFMTAFMERLRGELPPEISSQPPARYAQHYEPVVQAYVESLDKAKQLLARL